MIAYLLLAVGMTVEVIAAAALKAPDGFTRPLPSAAVVLGYALAFVLFAQVLRRLDLG